MNEGLSPYLQALLREPERAELRLLAYASHLWQAGRRPALYIGGLDSYRTLSVWISGLELGLEWAGRGLEIPAEKHDLWDYGANVFIPGRFSRELHGAHGPLSFLQAELGLDNQQLLREFGDWVEQWQSHLLDRQVVHRIPEVRGRAGLAAVVGEAFQASGRTADCLHLDGVNLHVPERQTVWGWVYDRPLEEAQPLHGPIRAATVAIYS